MHSDQPKTVGRPRVYEDASEKLSAFRTRQAASGYVRREVLMSAAAAETVKSLAAAHSVTALDVTSALFELGLAQYQPRFAGAAGQGTVGAVGLSASNGSEASLAEANPIQSFFTRRKDAHAQQAS